MSNIYMTLLTCTAIILVSVSVYSLLTDIFLRDHRRVEERLDNEFHQHIREDVRKKLPLFKGLDKAALQPLGELNGLPEGWRQRWTTTIEQAGMSISISQLTLLCMCCGITIGVLLGLLFQSLLVALCVTIFCWPLPLLWVRKKRNDRQESLRPQLPEAFDLMARALRAGQTIPQAMQAVSDEYAAPLSSEFLYCYEQQNLGLSPEMALRDLARRTGVPEINIFVVAVVVQRQVGGNLTDMLEDLARLVRERYRIRATIQTLTAEGRLQAGILLALPPAMLVAMFVLNRAYAMVLLDHYELLIGMGVSMLCGMLWIRNIVHFDY